MKKLLLFLGLTALCFGGASCHDYGYAPHTKTGAVAGGLIGAGTGLIVGHHRGRELEGAAVGAGVGALAGALLGSAEDDYHHYRRAYPRHYRGRDYYDYDHRSYYAPAPVYRRSSYHYRAPYRSFHGSYYSGGGYCY